jgi:hypothetical protein
MKSEESKLMDILNRASPLGNLDTNPKELHNPKSTPKKPTRNGGDVKNKLKLDVVLYKNEAWQDIDIMF